MRRGVCEEGRQAALCPPSWLAAVCVGGAPILIVPGLYHPTRQNAITGQILWHLPLEHLAATPTSLTCTHCNDSRSPNLSFLACMIHI